MNITELMKKLKDKKNSEGLRYIEVEDISDSQVCIDGAWCNVPWAWGICQKDGQWVYFETDNERGYICGIKTCMTEEEVCRYVYEDITGKAEEAEEEEDEPQDIARRYIQKEYGYSEKEAGEIIQQISEDRDVFEEFYNFLFSEEYCNSEWESVEVGSYSAKQLVEEEDFTPVAAYRFLVELRENREKAEKALRDGMVRKK